MATTQRELALQMLAQLRTLDPSVSAEVGTPERKIIDTVAQALSDAQVDLTQLAGALDIDSKYGANLDRFLALFGFGRQQAVRATGFVTFGRDVASTLDIRIPSGTQIMSPSGQVYETTFEVTLLAGEVTVVAPIRAINPGVNGNVSANQTFTFVGNPVYGIAKSEGPAITNPTPISGGIDVEDDDSLKVRFRNTVFRNLAGTQDQYMALAVSGAYTTKVNVVGPISRYREYIQVPRADDETAYDIDGDSVAETSQGDAGEWTTEISTIPYSKYTYTQVPNFVSNGKAGTQTVFFREDIDWRLNTDPAMKNRGDAFRAYTSSLPPDEGPDPTAVEHPDDPEGLARLGPNVTFLNVYNGNDDAVTAVRPGDIVLFEHSYMSTASRNDFVRNVTNAVDVFIDGENPTLANTVIPTPGVSTTTAFVNESASKYYRHAYRRFGEPDIPPSSGNLFIPLFWQPVTSVPSSIIVADENDSALFFLGEHYWFVEDTTLNYGTVRARNGIEWNPSAKGALDAGDGSPGARTGKALNEFAPNLSVEINGYTFDKNIVDLQAALEASKQVTTDVLVHRARPRYFKLDITVMYAPGANPLQVNEDMHAALTRYLNTQYFGNAVQLSDLLQVLHGVGGVDNVRWSTEVPGSTQFNRVAETNIGGRERPTKTDAAKPLTLDSDFFIKDNELPRLAQTVNGDGTDDTGFNGGDTDRERADAREFAVLPGLIIRTRAQNTWTSR